MSLKLTTIKISYGLIITLIFTFILSEGCKENKVNTVQDTEYVKSILKGTRPESEQYPNRPYSR